MISVTLTVHTAPLDGLEAWLEEFPQRASAIGQEVFEEIREHLLNELRFYPPVPANSRYKRTFRLRRGWVVTFEGHAQGFRIAVRNAVHYAQWVVGAMAWDRSAAARFQRDFHATNGWPLATDTAKFWYDTFVEEFRERFIADIGEFANTTFQRQAHTRI